MDGSTSAYLTRPLRTEIEVSALRDRADLYERALGYDEARAAYVARAGWHERLGHWVGLFSESLPGYEPVPSERATYVVNTLHADISAAFYTAIVDRLVDLGIILDDLRDSAPPDQRVTVELERARLNAALQRARGMVAAMRAEDKRRKGAAA